MKVSAGDAAFLKRILLSWKKRQLLNDAQANALSKDIEVAKFDWGSLATYSFWISVICIAIAVGALFADELFLNLLRSIYNAPHIVKLVGLALTAAGLYWLGIRRRNTAPEKTASNEAILFLGVLATAGAVIQLGRILDDKNGHYSLALLLACAIYAVLGFLFKSNLIWVFALLSLGSWFGAETGYLSGWGVYYLGMNYPLRFVLLGGTITGIAFTLENRTFFKRFFEPTLIMGLIYLFTSLWVMSIFGNYGEISAWRQVKQIELLHWSLFFGIVAGASVLHGLRFGSEITKAFGIVFLLINLYTRYFEHFWNLTHKAIFFALLGMSFWLIGTKAEKLWNLGKGKATS